MTPRKWKEVWIVTPLGMAPRIECSDPSIQPIGPPPYGVYTDYPLDAGRVCAQLNRMERAKITNTQDSNP